MGDRSSVYIEYRKGDDDRLCEIFGSHGEEHASLTDPPRIGVWFHGRNGGGFDECHALTKAGIPYLSHFDAGCEFDAGVMASAVGEVAECLATQDGIPVVRLHPDETPDPQDLAAWRRYQWLRSCALAAFAEKEK